ncbi:MAG: dihydrolipoyl dehydrogenase [Pirellulaceae bacterium]|nr:dihydrolipoyl dehydrogenase [Pirellulaceae bacterium]
MQEKEHDLVVIGGGPGGYVAAIRAAQLGMDVACVDENPALGGTCLRVGCIPSKALLESSYRLHAAEHTFASQGIQVGDISLDLNKMLEHKDGIVKTLTGGIKSLLKKNKVAVYQGRGKLTGANHVEVTGATEAKLTAKNILLATGSTPTIFPSIEVDYDKIGTSTTALSYPEVPKKLVVIGAGVIGLELGSVWSRLGSEVILLEAADRLLPMVDAEISRLAQRTFEKQGLKFQFGTFVESAKVEGDGCVVYLKEGEPITADRVLLSVGRAPCTKNLGLEELGVELDNHGFVQVDPNYQSSLPGLYAIGDCIGGAMLAHKASEEGIACVEKIAGQHAEVHYDKIPSVIYTHPEIAWVGQTEEELKEAGIAYRKGACPFGAIGRARSMGDIDGKVKILADEKTDRILGVHIMGANAGELIAEAVAAMQFGASSEDIAKTCHAHPTLAEAMLEAALAVDKRAIHC